MGMGQGVRSGGRRGPTSLFSHVSLPGSSDSFFVAMV